MESFTDPTVLVRIIYTEYVANIKKKPHSALVGARNKNKKNYNIMTMSK